MDHNFNSNATYVKTKIKHEIHHIFKDCSRELVWIYEQHKKKIMKYLQILPPIYQKLPPRIVTQDILIRLKQKKSYWDMKGEVIFDRYYAHTFSGIRMIDESIARDYGLIWDPNKESSFELDIEYIIDNDFNSRYYKYTWYSSVSALFESLKKRY